MKKNQILEFKNTKNSSVITITLDNFFKSNMWRDEIKRVADALIANGTQITVENEDHNFENMANYEALILGNWNWLTLSWTSSEGILPIWELDIR